MKFTISLLLSTLAGALAWTPLANAQFINGASSAGMGNAGIAAVDPGESQFLNPASVAVLQRYYMAGLYGLTTHPVDGSRTEWGVTLADGNPETILPGALSFIRRRTDYSSSATDTQTDIQLTLAGYPMPRLGVGVTAHRLVDQMYSATQVGSEYTQYNADLGLLWVPNSSIGIGVVAYDIVPTEASIPTAVKPVPTFGIGANYLWEKVFRMRMDIVRPDTNNNGRRINVGAGLETFFREDFGFRLGYQWRETADQGLFTTGLAYRGPRLNLDYSYQKDIRVAESSRHMFDLWLPF